MAENDEDLIRAAANAEATPSAAARILPLVDLTSLKGDETEAEIEALADRAMAKGVAAVCVYPKFVTTARQRLGTDPVGLASVVNFPDGSDDIFRTVEETKAIIADGADEIDMVAPLDAIMEGDVGLVTEMVDAVKAVADGRMLKVILETGRLQDPARITAAARAAIMAGADMLKTSTGKAPTGARLEDAAVLLAVLEEADGRVGLKLSGGIRTASQAAGYLHLIEHFMTSGWISPKTVRFGASSLLDDLERILSQPQPDDEG
ncbi:MAG: deoxyribose-phosphate aldolase [Alphaproteobacteria bacterium]|nr:deoxyribose-phosphate aldolase [Alphaproteobacteria bacterium]